MKCPNCGKEFGYCRIETMIWVCRHCGKESEFKIVDKVNKEVDTNGSNQTQ